MKKIVIKKKTLRKEFYIWLIAFALAFSFNIVAIIIYSASWIELFTQLHYVFLLSLFFYFTQLVVKSVFALVIKIIRKK